MTRSMTPGVDVSRWQGEINWRRVASAGYRFAVIRATVGNYYTDPRFYVNWERAKGAGLLLSAYHVITPERPADSQMGRFFAVLDDRRSDFPLVIDVELARGVSPQNIASCVEACSDLIREEDERKPVIYTARWFWNHYVVDSADWRLHDLWVAHYGVSSPVLPLGWNRWTFWQYTDLGQVPGIRSATDLNWFNGSYDDLKAYAVSEPADEEPPLAGLQAIVIVERLSVRSGPGRNYGNVGDLQEGDIVNVVSLAGDDVWIQIEAGKWIPFRSRGKRFLELM